MEPDAIVLDLGDANLPLSAAGLFGAARPLEVELGAGNGRFLLDSAATHPERGYLGVERARKYLELATTRARRRGLANVRLAHTTAEDLLFRCLAPGSVAAFHVYFPDPWPKKRHHKRRFFRAENVARLAEVLEPGGVLRVKTDHSDYAALIAALLGAEPRLIADGDPALFAELPATHFELRYARDARPVHRFAYLRR
ncbi:MAG TPA: hypothetical protein VLW17_00680 [Thermoanaerobaculaceae bacterium]|nr:hypothetical protein [Thermoanaerobaculaceae bacterium]